MYHIVCKEDAVSKDLAKQVSKVVTSVSQSKAAFMIAIGDDSFLLQTIQEMGDDQKPLLGIASTQSFLCQANTSNFKDSLTLIQKNKFSIQKKARITAQFNSEQYTALNDIGIFSSKSASVIRYTLHLDHDELWSDSADGILTSTPTGSTGYSHSAFGPIIINEPDILAITPISSLAKKSPLIVSNKTSIKISSVQGKNPIIIVDGDVRVPLKGDVSITKSEHDALFVRFAKPLVKQRVIRKDLPPSAKLVYSILSYEGSLTQKELISATALPERTVRHALDLLEKQRLITKRPYLSDARQMVYEL